MGTPQVAEAATPSAAQRRIITAALDLFARNGVGGTSLQMIADEIGVTKAADYHQYRTKEEIVLAVAGSELDRLRGVIEVAEAEPTPTRARDAVLRGIVDLAVDHRRTVGTLLGDPALSGLFVDHEAFRDVMSRLRRLLVDGEDEQAYLELTMLVAAISGAVTHPVVVDLDDEVLCEQLLRLARRFLGLRP